MATRKKRSVRRKKVLKNLNKAADATDLFSSFFFNYLDSRYKIRKHVDEARAETKRVLFAIKKEFLHTVVEGTLLFTAILALFLGITLLLWRLFPIDFIFLGYGVLIMVFVLARMRLS